MRDLKKAYQFCRSQCGWDKKLHRQVIEKKDIPCYVAEKKMLAFLKYLGKMMFIFFEMEDDAHIFFFFFFWGGSSRRRCLFNI